MSRTQAIACGAVLKMGESLPKPICRGRLQTAQLDLEPVRFTVVRHIRPQYACRQCETITAAVIDGGLATSGLLSWVTIQKYADHLLLYWIEQISTRHGAPIARSTLAEWTGRPHRHGVTIIS